MLIRLEVEHHVHAIAVVAEVLHVGVGQHVGLGEHDRIALAPLQELAHLSQHVVLLDRLAHVGALGGDHERHGIHAKAGHAELDPEPHDLEDLRLHVRIGGVQIRLELVEPMEVPLARHRDRASTSTSARPETPCPDAHAAASSSTTHTSRGTSTAGRGVLPGTRDGRWRCDSPRGR